jgi:hypothetical protein
MCPNEGVRGKTDLKRGYDGIPHSLAEFHGSGGKDRETSEKTSI